MRRRAFIDSSVLYAATISSKGYAHDLIRLAVAGQVELVTSSYVLAEVTQNLADKQPRALHTLNEIVRTIGWLVVDVSREEVLAAAEYTVLKDAPVVAAAVKADCDYLVTYDRKHLLNPPEVTQRSGLAIVTPDLVVAAIQDDDRAN